MEVNSLPGWGVILADRVALRSASLDQLPRPKSLTFLPCRRVLWLATSTVTIPVVMNGSDCHASASRSEKRVGSPRDGALESGTADSSRAGGLSR